MSCYRKIHPKKVKRSFRDMIADAHSQAEKGINAHAWIIETLRREAALTQRERTYEDLDYERRISQAETKITNLVIRRLHGGITSEHTS